MTYLSEPSASNGLSLAENAAQVKVSNASKTVDSSLKHKLRRSFSSAAKQYDSNAHIQRLVAQQALGFLQQDISKQGVCLDLGCGTAQYSAQLAKHVGSTLHVDLSSNMLRQARQHPDIVEQAHAYAGMDAEALALQNESVDWVFSSMALQWCQSPERVCAELHRILANTGGATLALMVDGSFAELQGAWQALHQPSRVNTFLGADAWIQAAQQAGFALSFEQVPFVSQHNNALDMLRSLKRIGASVALEQDEANSPKHKGSRGLSKQELAALDRIMTAEHCLIDEHSALPLTYEILFLRLLKSNKP